MNISFSSHFSGILCCLTTSILAIAPAQGEMRPFLQAHCFSCHGAERQKADLNLEALLDSPHPFGDPQPWEKALKLMQSGEMPPERQPRPEAEELQRVLAELETRLKESLAQQLPAPGRVTLRRLNRAEYNNTVRDLLGIQFSPADDFPPDDSGYGFDTIGDVLSISPMLMEKYLDAAERISRDVLLQETSFYAALSPGVAHVFMCGHKTDEHTVACCQENLRQLARRAYRRTPTEQELAGLGYFLELSLASGDSLLQGMELALQAMLVSPQFLFRFEQEPAPGEAARSLTAFELATRLSYFLWSSTPDDALLEKAESGALMEPAGLRAEVMRLLADPRARALSENFGGQWLEFRNLKRSDPDPELFPTVDSTLRADMAGETTEFLLALFQKDRSLLELIDADYTFLNERLAKHYGVEGVTGEAFQRVAVDQSQRGGLLTQASVLTVTSYPTRTSPVLRGLWVLKNILGTPPPPPPPNVPALDQAKVEKGASLRERLEAHRKDPTCASCHSRMDPLGFGLENYDAVGAWRTQEGEHTIDASGELPGGESFSGVAELKAILLRRKQEFIRCLTEKMLTYGLGRGLEAYDRPAVDQVVERLEASDYRASVLVQEIVASLPFQQRQAEAEQL